MIEVRYSVLFDKDIVAKDMDLETALILINGLANKYHNSMIGGSVISLMVDDRSLICEVLDPDA